MTEHTHTRKRKKDTENVTKKQTANELNRTEWNTTDFECERQAEANTEFLFSIGVTVMPSGRQATAPAVAIFDACPPRNFGCCCYILFSNFQLIGSHARTSHSHSFFIRCAPTLVLPLFPTFAGPLLNLWVSFSLFSIFIYFEFISTSDATHKFVLLIQNAERWLVHSCVYRVHSTHSTHSDIANNKGIENHMS